MVGLAADITHLEHKVSRDLMFYRQAPLLVRGCEQARIDSGRSVDRAGPSYRGSAGGRKRYVLLQRNEREQRTRQLLAGIVRWIGISPVRKVVLEVVVDSKAGPHRPASRAGWVPRQTDAWLQQQFGVVLAKARMADDRFCRDHKVFVKQIVRT